MRRGEDRLGIWCEAAIGDDQPGIAGVFADVDVDDVVARCVRCRGVELWLAGLRLDRIRRITAGGDLGIARRAARSLAVDARPNVRHVAADQPDTERDQPDDQQEGDELAGGAAALVQGDGCHGATPRRIAAIPTQDDGVV
jgi:hypothetical protein